MEIASAMNDLRKDVKLLSSKLDIVAMQIERLSRYVLPGEKIIKRPSGLPSFPVEDVEAFERMEKFLSDGENLSCAVCINFIAVFKAKGQGKNTGKLTTSRSLNITFSLNFFKIKFIRYENLVLK